ncbi:MAG: S8 family serine peptidase [Actinomycetota bacterium]
MTVRRFLAAAAVLTAGTLGSTLSVASSAPLEVSWNLDRINQAALPLDGNASVGTLTGEGIDIYVVDTGVRPTHEQINGRVLAGIDVIHPDDVERVAAAPTEDCDGHGTHVATTAAGNTVGVAVRARIVAVRVLDCDGNGEVEDVVTALAWIRDHHQSGRLAIANLSLGVDQGDNGQAIIDMVTELADDGVITVVAAGNGDGSGRGIDACRVAPGSEPVAVTVGATTRADAAASYSNNGKCVDIWAPGGDRVSGVFAGWFRSDTDYESDIGTSMAAPLVAGVLALLAQQQPSLCVSQMTDALLERSTKDVITGLDPASFNRLLRADTAPVTTLVAPGRPSNIVVTADSSSLLVGWDAPCDGGSPVTSTKVSVIYGGRTVKSVTVAGTKRAVRLQGLVPGRVYSVVVKSTNAVGPGGATVRVRAPRVTGLRVTRAIGRDALVGTDTGGTVVLRSLTPRICAVKGTNQRLVGVRAGRCRYTVRLENAPAEITRTIAVTR